MSENNSGRYSILIRNTSPPVESRKRDSASYIIGFWKAYDTLREYSNGEILSYPEGGIEFKVTVSQEDRDKIIKRLNRLRVESVCEPVNQGIEGS